MAGEKNPYTCRLLIRIDKILYRLKGKKCFWTSPKPLPCPLTHHQELKPMFIMIRNALKEYRGE